MRSKYKQPDFDILVYAHIIRMKIQLSVKQYKLPISRLIGLLYSNTPTMDMNM